MYIFIIRTNRYVLTYVCLWMEICIGLSKKRQQGRQAVKAIHSRARIRHGEIVYAQQEKLTQANENTNTVHIIKAKIFAILQ